MSNVDKIADKIHSPEPNYGCNEYKNIYGQESKYAPYYVAWIVVDGVKYYLSYISVDVNPDNDYLSWLPADKLPDVGERKIFSSTRASHFAFFDKWALQEGLNIAEDDTLDNNAEFKKTIARQPRI